MSAVEQATKSREDFFASFRDVLDTGIKFKKVMNKRGLKRAKCACPRCGKFLHGSISSYNGHFHMRCETAGCMSMME